MSGGDRFSYSSAPVRRISSIQFGILDPDFIVRCGGNTFFGFNNYVCMNGCGRLGRVWSATN